FGSVNSQLSASRGLTTPSVPKYTRFSYTWLVMEKDRPLKVLFGSSVTGMDFWARVRRWAEAPDGSSSAPSTRTFRMFASLCIFPPWGRLSDVFVRSVHRRHYKRDRDGRVAVASHRVEICRYTQAGSAGLRPARFAGTKRTYDPVRAPGAAAMLQVQS